MFKKKKKIAPEFIPTTQEVREASKVSVKDLIGGKMLSREVVLRQIPVILFVAALIVIYITNQYKGESIMRQIISLEKEVKELKSEYASVAFRRQQMSTQSEILKLISDKGLNLQEAKTPPFIIGMKR